MIFPLYQVLFYLFAGVLVMSAAGVVLVRNPVYSVLLLVLSFVASAVLWMLLQAEFLSLLLIFVYVGAVMTLFLFVVMMLNVDLSKWHEKLGYYLPSGILALVLFLSMVLWVLRPSVFPFAKATLPAAADVSNTQALGILLYTDYIPAVLVSGLLLLVAIVAAIGLVFQGRKPNTLAQRVSQQQAAQKRDRLRLVPVTRRVTDEGETT
ncbi:MAG: NADH:ubiquinone oxidoreductase subunit J [Gammaproteobacteria bacterium RIFCSPHIGHO2_12_FULL_45_9]|nr:MAG: NADH:ubiquinone oxidoreductase subunit J [Gammaproteobacteria bacterium RIFCSPHIGHO2_12_FULL_45_9]